MKRLVSVLCVWRAVALVGAEPSCIIEDRSVDEKVVVTAAADGLDVLGRAVATRGAAMDLRFAVRDWSSPRTVATDAPGLYLIIR